MPSSTATAASQVILVTGANKGIGYEAVKLLSRQLPNAVLLLGSRSLDNGQKAVEKIKSELTSDSAGAADNVRALELDVTDKASIEAAAARVKSEYGRLDVLMCNAGVSGAGGESAETVFAVNVDGVHDSIEAFLPLIPSSGQIVVVASEVGSWYAGTLPPALQQTLTAAEGVSWPLVQRLKADWLKAYHGQPSEQPWPDTHKTAGNYYLSSKAHVLAYLRGFAKQHPQPKLVSAQRSHREAQTQQQRASGTGVSAAHHSTPRG